MDREDNSLRSGVTPALELALTASGNLILVDAADASSSGSAALPEVAAAGLRDAMQRGSGALLIELATLPEPSALSANLAFWRGLAERYLTELCHIPEATEFLARPLAAPLDELADLIEAAPPMRGGEYLRLETLAHLWQCLDVEARAGIAAERGGVGAWLARRGPNWHRVGRVSFHLAENKRDGEFPFAFLATYAPKLLDGGRVQYQPLGRALEEYAGAKNHKLLVHLLTPVQRAAQACPWVRELVDSGQVFQPLRWTPDEALRLLRDVPVLESAGLLVRVPNWWTKRPPRVQVGVSIGSRPVSRFGADAMLDFRVETTLNGQALTPEEWARILEGSDGLVLLKGQWVEVDRDKLQQTLQHWKRVEEESGGDGISFLQGMRLLAGAAVDTGSAALLQQHDPVWAEVHAGEWLSQLLRQLRQPESADLALPPADLRAVLRPYQQVGVKWLWMLTQLRLGACLADDMGLGKTIQVLSLLLLARRGKRSAAQRPALLVLPASLLANWKAEIEKFAPTLKCLFAHPSQATTAELAAMGKNAQVGFRGIDVVLTTYSMVARLEWLGVVDWSLVVLDEAQVIKNPGARQTRAVKQLRADARIALTGTPVENRLADLWSIFDFLCPGLLGSVKTFGAFVKNMEQRTADRFGPLRKLVGPYILRRLKTDKSIIADLPDKIEQTAYCHLSKRQAVLYEESVRELGRALERQSADIARRGVVLAFIQRFKQICNHPDQWVGARAYAPDESGKFNRLRELGEEIASRQEKLLVFSQFREMTEPLAGFLATVFGRSGLALHGGTPVGKRKDLVNAFQSETGPPFMVLSLKAGGTGLNLTAASHVIHFDRWWNPAVENQATDRAFRIGQTRNVVVHKFVCQGTIEEKIDSLIGDKSALAGEILAEGVPTLVTEMSDAELLNLVRLDIRRAMEE